MSAPYTPQQNSLAWRVVAYFRRLPDEELTHHDIALKWHTDSKNVSKQLAEAVASNLLKRDGLVFSAGSDIERFDLTPQALAISDQPAPKKPRLAPLVDIEAIEFENIPETAAQAMARVHQRWVAKIATMPAGKSFSMPMAHRHALRTAVTELRKKGWKLSVLNEGEDRVRVVCFEVGDRP